VNHPAAPTVARQPVAAALGVRREFPATRRSPARAALDGVTLDVLPGEWIALLGANGSGKSTLLRILAGADAPTQGRANVMGLSPGARAARAHVGVVFQRPGLDPLLTVRENLALQGALFGLRAAPLADRIARAAADLSIADRLDDRVGSLSGGLQRRADLARALIATPRLLLVDEPTAGLDPRARAEFLDALARLRQGSGAAIVMSAHHMDEAERADRVVMLAHGKVVADDSPARLRARLGPAMLRAEGAPDAAPYAGASPEALADAAQRLIRSGVPFSFAPPTLADVYESLTGASLNAGAEDAP